MNELDPSLLIIHLIQWSPTLEEVSAWEHWAMFLSLCLWTLHCGCPKLHSVEGSPQISCVAFRHVTNKCIPYLYYTANNAQKLEFKRLSNFNLPWCNSAGAHVPVSTFLFCLALSLLPIARDPTTRKKIIYFYGSPFPIWQRTFQRCFISFSFLARFSI